MTRHQLISQLPDAMFARGEVPPSIGDVFTWQPYGGDWITPSVVSGGLAAYGDGSDGSPTFDGSTTILGAAPVANVYTMTRDWYLASPTINNGVTIITNGYRLFASGTITGGGAAAGIVWNGNVSFNGSYGGGNQIGNGVGTIFTQSGVAGYGGGQSNNANGSNGGTPAVPSYGGSGGGGGNGSGGTLGAAGGVAVAPTAAYQSFHSLDAVRALLLFNNTGTSQLVAVVGGGGGAGGGGDTANPGGGGGGGGGQVVVVARAFAGTGVIQARGGAGISPSSNNVGGGGGGGGGWVVVISGSVSGGAISGWAIDANGGAAGAGHGTGLTGIAGSNGSVFLIPN
jgi:hypothetical protein